MSDESYRLVPDRGLDRSMTRSERFEMTNNRVMCQIEGVLVALEHCVSSKSIHVVDKLLYQDVSVIKYFK
jgi:hypothetical protein